VQFGEVRPSSSVTTKPPGGRTIISIDGVAPRNKKSATTYDFTNGRSNQLNFQ
jgi:hypothetical protein